MDFYYCFLRERDEVKGETMRVQNICSGRGCPERERRAKIGDVGILQTNHQPVGFFIQSVFVDTGHDYCCRGFVMVREGKGGIKGRSLSILIF